MRWTIKYLNKIVAIVVLYHPFKGELVSKIELLKRAVEHVVLVDNTETGTAWLAELYCSKASPINISYFQSMKNLGIAAAQNLALDFVFQRFNDHNKVIFFDQDSQINEGLPLSLAKEFDRLNQHLLVAAVGPSLIDEDKGFTYPQVNWNTNGIFQRFIPDFQYSEQKVCALISSSMLTSVYHLKKIGMYDDNLFIDYVDTDWCLKAQSKGYELYMIPHITMQHAIGVKSIKVLGRNLSVHSPIRRYYMIRNSFFMSKKQYVSNRLAFSFVYRTLVHHLILIGLEQDKKAMLMALFKGILDGVLSKVRPHYQLVASITVPKKNK